MNASVHRFWIPVAGTMALLASGCLVSGDARTRSGYTGHGAAEVEEPSVSGGTVVHRMEGPVLVRLEAGEQFTLTARFMRNSSRGRRHAELFIRAPLPGSTPSRVASFRATYTEVAVGGSIREVYDGEGTMRAELTTGWGHFGLKAAVDLALVPRSTAGGLKPLTFRGAFSSDLSFFYGGYEDFGYDIWVDPFFPYLALEDPEIEYHSWYADDYGYAPWSWYDEEGSDSYYQYGYDYGSGDGYDSGYSGSGDYDTGGGWGGDD